MVPAEHEIKTWSAETLYRYHERIAILTDNLRDPTSQELEIALEQAQDHHFWETTGTERTR